MEEYLVPTLIIHNFVENAITHAVSLDNHVEITLYIVNENYEDGEYLYICVSDTGKDSRRIFWKQLSRISLFIIMTGSISAFRIR